MVRTKFPKAEEHFLLLWNCSSYYMKIDSRAEAAALNALRFTQPMVFHKGRPTIVSVQNKSRLNVIPSHADWNPVGEGVKDYCVEKMNKVLGEVLAVEIRNIFEAKSTTHMIASKRLTANVSFLNQMCSCIESIYKRLLSFSKFAAEQVWSLTSQVWIRFSPTCPCPRPTLCSD
jgi:hypothetical protein